MPDLCRAFQPLLAPRFWFYGIFTVWFCVVFLLAGEESGKYLGTVLNQAFTFSEHVAVQYQAVNTR